MAKTFSYIKRIKEKDNLEFWDTSLRKEWNVLTIQEKVSAFMAVHKGNYEGSARTIYTMVLAEEDLNFIVNNKNLFTQEQFQSLWAQKITLTNNNSIINSGFKYNFEALKFEEIPTDKNYIEALLETLIAVRGSGKDPLENAQNDLTNKLIKYIRQNNTQVFDIIAFEEFSYENYDKEIVVELNKYLRSGPSVWGLERAIENGDFYSWMTGEGESISKDRIQLVDPSLLEIRVDDYTRPFKLIGREGSKTAGLKIGINDVFFEEGSSFSQFQITNLRTDKSDLFSWLGLGDDKVNLVEKNYFSFFLKLLSAVASQKSGTRFDIENTTQHFNDQIRILLEATTIDFINDISWSVNDEKLNVPFREFIAKKFLDDFRFAAWKEYAKIINPLKDSEISAAEQNPQKIAIEAFIAGEEAAKNSDVFDRDPNAPEDDGLTEDEIQERQKFLKQCALMTRLDEMAREHLQVIEERAFPDSGAEHISGRLGYYNNRLYMVKDGNHDQHGIVSKLLLPKASSINEFLDIEPSTHAYLVPKLRFFKVFQQGSLSKQEEFKFRNFTLSRRVNNLRSTDYDKGGDYGIKEFSFSFEGTTPATAKNDIKANLSLYFQSFDDFINKQPENNSPFVDMLLLPGGKKKGSGQESPFQFQPDYYRLRVDVGWIIPDNKLANVIGQSRYNSLLDALTKTNKSFYLNMVDHTIDFRDDGSVQIDVEYRAYIESALKGTILDALSSRETRAAANKARQDYLTILNSKKCNAKELGQIKRQLLQIEDLLKKQTYQSIMKRLLEYDMLYYKKLRTTSANSFVRNGFFTSKVSFATDSAEPNNETNLQESTVKKTLNYGDNFYNEDIGSDKDHLLVNYFYLGDLLYVILDSLYDDNDNYYEGYENFKFVLGSLQYEDIFDSTFKNINIASIPVSAELFFEWYTENIIKPERNSYPIMFFIRDLLKYLIGEILSETCFKRSLDKKLQFHTTNFIGIEDPLSLLFSKGDPIIDANVQYKKGTLPLVQDDGKPHTISDFTNYIMIYVDTPKLSINGKNGNKQEDGDIGIYHYQIGRPKGLLKKLNFSKTDMQYIREARFFRNGFDGLMQLANVYNVNLDMIGNTLYYPGMEIYVNPLGFMGAANNNYDPTQTNSIANKLGFGGYHLVTSVKSTIAPGKFTTQVTAMFNYSGDGDPAKVVVGTSEEIKPVVEKPKVDDRPQTSKDYCSAAYNQVIDTALNIVNNKTQSYPGIDFNTINQTIAQSNAAKWEQAEKSIEEINDVSFEELRVREQLRKNQEGGN